METPEYPYDGKHAFDLHYCEVCEAPHWARRDQPGRFCSKRCAQAGENNTVWKGADAGYISKHARVYRLRGKAESCVWGCVHTRYEWANLTGNYDDPEDYASMCSQCHARFDAAIRKTEKDGLCHRGHPLSGDNIYTYMRGGREIRNCKACIKIRKEGGQ